MKHPDYSQPEEQLNKSLIRKRKGIDEKQITFFII